MWTRKNSLVIATVRIGWFPFFVIFPFRCLGEVVEGLSDLLSLFRFTNLHVQEVMTELEQMVDNVRRSGPLDIADIKIRSHEGNVRVRLLLR